MTVLGIDTLDIELSVYITLTIGEPLKYKKKSG